MEILGLKPDEVLIREAMVKPQRKIIDSAQIEASEYNLLSKKNLKNLDRRSEKQHIFAS